MVKDFACWVSIVWDNSVCFFGMSKITWNVVSLSWLWVRWQVRWVALKAIYILWCLCNPHRLITSGIYDRRLGLIWSVPKGCPWGCVIFPIVAMLLELSRKNASSADVHAIIGVLYRGPFCFIVYVARGFAWGGPCDLDTYMWVELTWSDIGAGTELEKLTGDITRNNSVSIEDERERDTSKLTSSKQTEDILLTFSISVVNLDNHKSVANPPKNWVNHSYPCRLNHNP